jgi:hypothetical protein
MIKEHPLQNHGACYSAQPTVHFTVRLRLEFLLLVSPYTSYIALTKDCYTIGRHRTADIVVDAAEVSNTHCRIYRRPDDGLVLVEDVSLNGTRLNGRRIPRDSPHPLSHQDQLSIKSVSGFCTLGFIMRFTLNYCLLDLIFHDLFHHPNSKPQLVDDYYLLDNVLGRGGHAIVRLAICRQTGERIACKVIERPRFLCAAAAKQHALLPADVREMRERQQWRSIRQEVDILMQLNHVS